MSASLRLLKTRLKNLVERTFNITIYRALPRGIDPLHDLEQLIPAWEPATIFDVGANIGQSARVYAKKFPSAKILSFEPAAATFQQLGRNATAFPNVQCVKLAFASEAGTGILAHGEHSDMNRLVPVKQNEALAQPANTECVDQTTVDAFCRDHRIQKIDYLKIDTEGADLDVLRGAQQMLRSGLIDVIEVEAGIGLDNEVHVPLQKLRDHLESRGYQIFGFYEQVNEWKQQLPHLRRTNVVFILKSLDQLGRVTN